MKCGSCNRGTSKGRIEIKLISFTDYATPNRALNDGETDLNAFQHHAYLNDEVKNNGYKIEAIETHLYLP